MRFRLLGPFEVAAEDQPVPVGPPRQQVLLATLVVLRNRVVPPDRLVTALWGEDPPRAAGSTLQAYVSRLRRSLATAGAPDGILETQQPGYILHVSDDDDVDAERFERQVADGRTHLHRGDVDAAADLLREALAMWRGPALAGLTEQGLLAAEATRLEELRLAALEDRLQADLDRGHHAELIGELESLVAEHPFRERLRAHLMLALYRAGRQADALDSYQRAARALRDELGLDPSEELHELHQRILRHDESLAVPTRRPSVPQAGAPQAGRFRLPALRETPIGRDEDLQAVTAMLQRSRLVTLTGPGGSGKTTLALHAGHALQDDYADGAVLVDLTSVEDPRDVGAAALMALDSHRQGTDQAVAAVAQVLGDREVLLVLDGCEHVIDAAAELVDALLEAGPGVRVLATSQHPLEVGGEHRWPVTPLELPTRDTDPAEVVRTPSVALFVRRARAVDPRLRLTDEQADKAAQIVTELDGIPLAIELAAARTASMPIGDIARHLDDRFRLLRHGLRTATDRQRTLEAAIGWSEQLLDDDERRLMTHLAALPGGASAATARTVAVPEGTDELAVLDLLEALVSKSMLVADTRAGEARYRMLESIRAYFARRLDEDADAEAIRARLADHLLQLARAAGRAVRTAEGSDAISRFDAELPNLPAVRTWALSDGDPTLLFELVCAVPLVAEWWVRPALDEIMVAAARAAERLDHPQWPAVAAATAASLVMRGQPDRARRQLELACERLERGHPLRPVAHQFRVHLALMTGETETGIRTARACLEEAAAAGDRWMEGFALASLTLALAVAERRGEAVKTMRRCAEAMTAIDSPVLAAWCAYVRGEVLADDDPEEATRHYRSAVRLARDSGADQILGVALIGLSSARARHGEATEALTVFADTLEHHLNASRWQMCWSALLNLTQPLSRLGQHASVLEIVAAAETSETCPPLYGEMAGRVEAVSERAEQALGSEAAAEARRRGAAHSDPAAVRAALATITRLRAAPH